MIKENNKWFQSITSAFYRPDNHPPDLVVSFCVKRDRIPRPFD